MQDVWTNIHCVLSYSLLVDVCICFFTASARCSLDLMQQKAREPTVSLGADTVSRAYRGHADCVYYSCFPQGIRASEVTRLLEM